MLLADDVLASIRADRAGASDLLTDWTTSWSIVVQSVNKPSGGFRCTRTRTRTQTEWNKAVILEILTTGYAEWENLGFIPWFPIATGQLA